MYLYVRCMHTSLQMCMCVMQLKNVCICIYEIVFVNKLK